MIEQITTHIKNILLYNCKIKSSARVMIIYDEQTQLSKIMKQGIEQACENLAHSFDPFDFDKTPLDTIINDIDEFYREDDIVFLVQSTSFRASKFRWRNELCSRGLTVIEFGQLRKIKEEEYQGYIDSLTYDYPHYKEISKKLTNHINKAQTTTIICRNGSKIKYSGVLDKPIVNDGDFSKQKNKGSRFPIGEVITEGKELNTLNGEIEVYAYPNNNQETTFVQPFTCKIKNGLLVEHNGNKEFEEIVESIKTEHPKGWVYVREFGLGLNRFIKRFARIGDPISYERQEGLHFSLGMKHGMYQKKLWPVYGKKFNQKYHVDVYVNVDKIYFDDELVFQYPGGFLVNTHQ